MNVSVPPLPRPARRLAATALTGVLLGTSLTACGNDDAEGSGEPTSTENAASSPAERVEYPVSEVEADPEQNWAEVYLPEGNHDEDSVPLVILLRGGAWNERSNGADDVRDIARSLAERGVAVYNVEYRDRDSGNHGWPETYTDVADAIDYVPELDEQFPEIITEDATVAGHSSGGQLATWAATRDNLAEDEVGADPVFIPRRVVSLAGPLDLEWDARNGDDNTYEVLGGPPSEEPERYASIDPIQNIDRDVPVVAVHGADDSLVDAENSRRYVHAASEDGAPAELVLLEEGDHVSFLKRKSSEFAEVIDIIVSVATEPRDDLLERLDGGTREWSEQ